jgi:hypothetical protein
MLKRGCIALTVLVTERVEVFFVFSYVQWGLSVSILFRSSFGTLLMFSYEACSLIDIADWEMDAKAF